MTKNSILWKTASHWGELAWGGPLALRNVFQSLAATSQSNIEGASVLRAEVQGFGLKNASAVWNPCIKPRFPNNHTLGIKLLSGFTLPVWPSHNFFIMAPGISAFDWDPKAAREVGKLYSECELWWEIVGMKNLRAGWVEAGHFRW